jgi:hypothetical protein
MSAPRRRSDRPASGRRPNSPPPRGTGRSQSGGGLLREIDTGTFYASLGQHGPPNTAVAWFFAQKLANDTGWERRYWATGPQFPANATPKVWAITRTDEYGTGSPNDISAWQSAHLSASAKHYHDVGQNIVAPVAGSTLAAFTITVDSDANPRGWVLVATKAGQPRREYWYWNGRLTPPAPTNTFKWTIAKVTIDPPGDFAAWASSAGPSGATTKRQHVVAND